MASWHWRPAPLFGYAFHTGTGTAWIQLATRHRPGTLPVLVEDAKQADAFDVALIVGGLPTERYRLRGPLDRLQRKLPALLARRERARVATALPRHDWTWPSEVAVDG